MNKQYSAKFKLETVKRIEITGESVSKAVEELGIKSTTMQGWVKNISSHLIHHSLEVVILVQRIKN